ncbi:sugar kinase [Aminobacter aminovorans]|uniref:sugar kinase n=1 Tax=Aminobacter aminovorans TaxID=83263 RepID=UPI002858E8F2|nr:sugar kinase [Aminobacter aminovorans]MDR7221386.1 2-dehydro-3-deoxygluconokinase [Aminobacter aminovorans]
MTTVLALGECMVELAPVGQDVYRQSFAGDTFNTAWYLRRLLPAGWTVAYGSCVGTDAISERMLAFMEAAGIETAGIRRVGEQTVGLYLISLEGGERSFNYWRSASAARHLAADPEWLEGLLAQRRVILISGITLAILPEQDRLTLATALLRARAAGSIIVFDPNLRPGLWLDPGMMRAAVTAAARTADIVLPSFDEERNCFGDASPLDTVERYRSLGANVVVVKNGPDEIIAWDRHQGAATFSPRPVPPVDTTAAGDSFNAGFLAARLLGADLDAALASGAGLSAQVVQAPGALVAVSAELPG